MFRAWFLLSLLLMTACRAGAEVPVVDWPEFDCGDSAKVLRFVDLDICLEQHSYTDLRILAGETPSMVFEQGEERFDVISYEDNNPALANIAGHLGKENKLQALGALFGLRSDVEKSDKEETILRVFGISESTELLFFAVSEHKAYIKVNADSADNTIYIASANHNAVYRLIGNFTIEEAKVWLTHLRPNQQ